MKKLSTIIIAIALVLGMSQCKKNVEQVASSQYGKAVYITVKVKNSGKHQVVTGTGAVNYTAGDHIYVGNNGKYIGTLEYSNGAFSGTIYDPSPEDYLHFYFVGGLPVDDLTIGSTTSFTVNIRDQRTALPVLSYAKSDVLYSDNNTTYSTELKNKCALVKFALTNSTDETVCVGGMKTWADISFADPNNAIVAQNSTDNIMLYPASGTEKWAILLPQAQVEDAYVEIDGDDYTVTVPTITINAYITSGIEIENTPKWHYHGYKVGENKYVHFAFSNLEYKDGEGWRFAPDEYDSYETYRHIYETADTFDVTGWVEHFGWGTWGPNKDPLLTTHDQSQYSWDGDYSGPDPYGEGLPWRTLTRDEWEYLFNNNPSCDVTVCAEDENHITHYYKGVIIRPYGKEEFTISSCDPQTVAEEVSNMSVFLPYAGYGFLYQGAVDMDQVNTHAYYWSSTIRIDENNYNNSAWHLYRSQNNTQMAADWFSVKMCVRLVVDDDAMGKSQLSNWIKK